ncbi:MAG: phosphopantetheine-binding protein [Pseudomonadales bacterium]
MGLALLEAELKQLIIDTLELEDITVDDINSDEALFNEGLGLDSIDALELGVALHNRYGIKLDSEAEENREFFASVSRLAAMVDSRRVDTGNDDEVA